MAIISQETWDKFTEEEKERLRSIYSEAKEVGTRNIRELEEFFGKANLQPKPKIRTWKDVEKAEGGEIRVDSKVINPNGRAWGLGLKYHQKAEATLKLAILIELGYGGMITEEEWKDEDTHIWFIDFNEKSEFDVYDSSRPYFYFIAFHEESQAEEFMSYPENVELVKQYNMI